jgi:hypothetical protein
MNPIIYRTLATGITLSILSGCVVAVPGPPPPPAGFVAVDIDAGDGYRHHGWWDNNHVWHGGYYDAGHAYHADPPDWHH